MSVNISVSGKTLKDCHEQILALADEIVGNTKDAVKDPIASEPVPMVGVAFPGTPAPVNNVMKFPITPEVASVSQGQSQRHATQSVPQTTTPASNTSHGTEGVDSRGLPWDERIHSSNKEKSEKTGEWRRRRGVSPEVEAQVEAELRGQAPAKKVAPFGSMTPEQYQQAVTPAPVAAPVPMPTTEHRVSLPVGPDVLSAAQIPATPVPSFAPPAMQVMPPNTFTPESFRNNLMNVLNDLAAAGKINHEWINAQKVQFGGKDVTQWYENAEACNSLFEAFVGWGLVNRL